MQKLFVTLVFVLFSFYTSFAQTEKSVEVTMSKIPLKDGYVVPDAIMDSLNVYSELEVDDPYVVLSFEQYNANIPDYDQDMSLVETKIVNKIQSKLSSKFDFVISNDEIMFTVTNKTVKLISKKIHSISLSLVEKDPKKFYEKYKHIDLAIYVDDEVELIILSEEGVVYLFVSSDQDVSYIITSDGNFEKEILDLD